MDTVVRGHGDVDTVTVVRGHGDGGSSRARLHVLRRAVPGRHVHHPHEATQPLLRHQPHLSLPAHLRRLVPRLLSAGRVRREGQPRDTRSTSRYKVNLEITILLALVVFLLRVGETMPPTPDSIPILGA